MPEDINAQFEWVAISTQERNNVRTLAGHLSHISFVFALNWEKLHPLSERLVPLDISIDQLHQNYNLGQTPLFYTLLNR